MNDRITEVRRIPCIKCGKQWGQSVTTEASTFVCPSCEMDEMDWQDYLTSLSPEERCKVCGQPDNCGDCNHDPITDEVERNTIMGKN